MLDIRHPNQRILRGVAASLAFTNIDSDGTNTAAAGAVTVGVTKGDGSTLVASATATTGSNPYLYALSAANNTELQWLSATWTDAGDSSAHTTLIEVVGGYYASIADIRNSDSSLTDAVKYPDARILQVRWDTEVEFETACGVSFVPRYRRVRLDGNGRSLLALPDVMVRTVRSVRVYSDETTYEAFTVAELAAVDVSNGAGMIHRTDGGVFAYGHKNIVVEYEHGFDRPPADVRQAFLTRVRSRLNFDKTGIPDRATTYVPAEGGTFSLSTPGRGGSITGIPDVDVVLARYGHNLPGFA